MASAKVIHAQIFHSYFLLSSFMTMMSFSIPLLPSSRVPASALVFISFPFMWAPAPVPSVSWRLGIQIASPRLPGVHWSRPPAFFLPGLPSSVPLVLPVVTEFFHVHVYHVPDHLRIWLLGYMNILSSIGLASSFIISHFCQDFKVRFWTFSTIILIDFCSQVYKEITVIFSNLGIRALFLCILNYKIIEGKTIGLGQITNKPFVILRNFNRWWRINP